MVVVVVVVVVVIVDLVVFKLLLYINIYYIVIMSSNNFFENLMENPIDIQDMLLGPDYKYWKKIKNPIELGMGTGGSIGQLEKDVDGLFNYVKLLITGQGDASTTGRPLGNRYFLQTPATCKAKDSGEGVSRYLYVNNIPLGNIPFISSAMGEDFDTFEGLVPGILQDMEVFNPFRVFAAFQLGQDPECEEITMDVTPTSVNDYRSMQTEYVSSFDIRQMDPCEFPDKYNPLTKQRCVEGFTNRNQNNKINRSINHKINNNKLSVIETIYYFILSCLVIYLLYRLVRSKKCF